MARTVSGFIKASQFADWCGVDIKTIHNWTVKEGKEIPHIRTPGGHLRYLPQVVQEVLTKYGFPIPHELQALLPLKPPAASKSHV